MPSKLSHFEALQHGLRSLKKTHGVDLTEPHGVKLDGKLYPASHKRMLVGIDSTGPFNETNFKIPLENGLRVDVKTDYDNLNMQLYVPTINIDKDNKRVYRYGPALHQHEDAYYASFGENKNKTDEYYMQNPNPFYEEHVSLHNTRGPISDVHEVLSMWSQEPYQGTYDLEPGGYKHFEKIRNLDSGHYRPKLQLNEDELAEHRKNYKSYPQHASHFITVLSTEDIPKTTYNIKTEQLRPFKDVFKEDTLDD